MFDIVIRGGQLVDGTGSGLRRADVGITGDRISAVADLPSAEAPTIVDATNRLVCPGFIDAHSHSDTFLLIEPSAPSKTYQGITTEVVGNCGASAAPLTGQYRMPADWCDKQYPGTWHTVAEYRDLLESVEPAPNVVFLVGHNGLRAGTIGYRPRRATPAESRAMVRLLEKGMDEGARGLSTGLIYAPAMFASDQELIELAHAVAAKEGIYTTHMRSESRELLKAIDEVLAIGRQTGVRVQISHLKTAGEEAWSLVDEALEAIEQAREEGIDVGADRYPYTVSCTQLDVVFPPWASAGGRGTVLDRLRDPEQRQRLHDALAESRGPEQWASVTIASTTRPEFRGMPLWDVAKRMGVDPVTALLRLCEEDELNTTAFFAGMSEANMWQILGMPWVMLCTDASLRAPTGPLSEDFPHPRTYGSFPRFLRASLNGQTVGLPEAVRKMTSLPARQFRLSRRGVLAEGYAADVVVVDPTTVRDKATFRTPHQLAEGIETVIVNGVLTLSGGQLTGARGGRFL